MLDVDLALRTDLRGALRDVLEGGSTSNPEEVGAGEEAEKGEGVDEKRMELGRELRRGLAALVVPVFEYSDPAEEPEDYHDFPGNKTVSHEESHGLGYRFTREMFRS